MIEAAPNAAQNGNGAGQQEEGIRIPDVVLSLVGKQQIQIALLESQLQMFQMQQTQQAPMMQESVKEG